MKKETILLYLSIICVALFIVSFLIHPIGPEGTNRNRFSDPAGITDGKLVKVPNNDSKGLYYVGNALLISKSGRESSSGYQVLRIEDLYSNKDSLYYKLSNGEYINQHDVSLFYLYKTKKEAEFKAPLIQQQDRLFRLQTRIRDITMYCLLAMSILMLTIYQIVKHRKNQKGSINK
mgnify:CR=1 FL=1